MMNKENYTGYTGTNGRKVTYTGSVRDYFSDNSAGQFQPEFDVYGPYTIDYSQYAANGTSNSAKLINAAVNAADADINFSQYDRDGDGYVDMIYFIFAGNGANYSGNDSRLYWPHRSVVYNPTTYGYVRKDGVYLYDYASSVELYGYTDYPSSVTIDGIGTICHEFSHVLGLPDFYDADYEGSGGESNHPDIWSVMAGGSYENYGRTPVGYSLYERYAVGFTEPQVINGEGSYTLDPIASSNTGYRIDTPVENEYFLLENRQVNAFKWDAYLPGSGMLVFRVDETNPRVWSSNQVNNNPSHNYYELLRAGGTGHSNPNSGHTGSAYDPFPGTGRVTELHNATSPANLLTWAGNSTQWGLTNIAMSNGVISFDIRDTYVLSSISIEETLNVGVGITRALTATADPSFAKYTLSWESSDETVATVDQEGHVTGIAAGTCTVTVTSDNGCTASCLVTVVEEQVYNVADFKEQEEGSEHLLQFDNAEVLYVYNDNAYVRDATGNIVLANTGLDLKKNDIISGTVYAQVAVSNKMPQAVGFGGETGGSNITIVAGDEVQPREVKMEELTEVDYADYVVVKGVELERNNGVYAIAGDKRARLVNTFQIKGISVPKTTDGKKFDIMAIYGTDLLNGEVIDELYLLQSPVESEDEPVIDGIQEVRSSVQNDNAPYYNLNGQRVEKTTKGILIQNGKKFIQK